MSAHDGILTGICSPGDPPGVHDMRTTSSASSGGGRRHVLSTPDDPNWLSEPLCILRSQIEVFAATAEDVGARGKRGGLKKPLTLGRVGIRCVHCARLPYKDRARGAVSYPKSIRLMHQAVRNYLRYHFHACPEIPASTKAKLDSVRNPKEQSKKVSNEYWVQCCEQMGLVDVTEEGTEEEVVGKGGGKGGGTGKSSRGSGADESIRFRSDVTPDVSGSGSYIGDRSRDADDGRGPSPSGGDVNIPEQPNDPKKEKDEQILSTQYVRESYRLDYDSTLLLSTDSSLAWLLLCTDLIAEGRAGQGRGTAAEPAFLNPAPYLVPRRKKLRPRRQEIRHHRRRSLSFQLAASAAMPSLNLIPRPIKSAATPRGDDDDAAHESPRLRSPGPGPFPPAADAPMTPCMPVPSSDAAATFAAAATAAATAAVAAYTAYIRRTSNAAVAPAAMRTPRLSSTDRGGEGQTFDSRGGARKRPAALASTGWETRLEELRQYKAKHGHCNTPQRCIENKQLGLWVSRQRAQYRLRQQGKKSSMTDERISALESVGFQWAVAAPVTQWETRLEELRQYKVKYGHCNMPECCENTKLGIWVKNQRSQYQFRQRGKKSCMTDMRIASLDIIGFQWVIKARAPYRKTVSGTTWDSSQGRYKSESKCKCDSCGSFSFETFTERCAHEAGCCSAQTT